MTPLLLPLLCYAAGAQNSARPTLLRSYSATLNGRLGFGANNHRIENGAARSGRRTVCSLQAPPRHFKQGVAVGRRTDVKAGI